MHKKIPSATDILEQLPTQVLTKQSTYFSLWVKWCGDHHELTDFRGDGKEESSMKENEP
jgi:hypothetical protein